MCIPEVTDFSKVRLVFQSTCKSKVFMNFRPVLVMQLQQVTELTEWKVVTELLGLLLISSQFQLLECRVALTQLLLSSELMGLVHFLMGRCWQVQLCNVWSLREWNEQCRRSKVCPCPQHGLEHDAGERSLLQRCA